MLTALPHSPRVRRLLLLPALATLLALGNLLVAPALSAASYEEGRKAYIDGKYREALKILEPLARDGNSEAQKMLGIMYDYGHGVKADSEQALHWYLLSAEQGHPAVQYQVGAKYFRGDGVKQDYREAAKWWEMAASGGQVDAQFNLGLMYFRGLSVPVNDEKAVRLFSQAAAQGHGHSQYSLAVMYAFGRGVDKDYSTALTWFEQAAAQDIGQAQFNLGVFYENGYGVDKDLALARSWYEKAAAQDVVEAKNKLAALGDAAAKSSSGVDAAAEIDVALEETSPARDADGIDMATAEAVAPPAAEDSRDVTADYDINNIAIDGIHREAWVLSQLPEHYTLQIGSVTREDDIVNFIRDNRLSSEAAYIQIVIKDVTRYNALYGVYESYAEATAAIESLPPPLRKVQPWVRSFKMLQQLITQEQ